MKDKSRTYYRGDGRVKPKGIPGAVNTSAAAASSRQGVDVVLGKENIIDGPLCPHGPTVLFERFTGDEIKRFYACSAFRDRKDCTFHCKEEDAKKRKNRQNQRLESGNESDLDVRVQNRTTFEESLDQFKKEIVEKKEVKFCFDCETLFSYLNDKGKQHQEHKCTAALSDKDLKSPSLSLTPLSFDKSNAQYFFSEDSCKVIVSLLKKSQSKNVLCIGTPRIHEKLLQQSGMNSLLLDLDSRYMNFFPKSFCHFNMCNGHLFNSKDATMLSDFLCSCDSIIIDPPFGALSILIAACIKRFFAQIEKKNSTLDKKPNLFWIFPSYLQKSLYGNMPDMDMLSYRVNYTNHKEYKKKKRDTQIEDASRVRVFTNVDPSTLPLPSPDYKFCKSKDCRKWISKYNEHCEICRTCPTLEGTKVYRHCFDCQKCVKPNRVHCKTCSLCLLPAHECDEVSKVNENAGKCHICGGKGHLRTQCPKRNKETKESAKRPSEVQPIRKKAKNGKKAESFI